MFDKVPRKLGGERRESFYKMVLEQLDIHMKKNEVGLLSHTIHKKLIQSAS